MQYEIEAGGKVRQVVVHRANGAFVVSIDGRDIPVDAVRVDGDTWSLIIDGESHEVTVAPGASGGPLAVGLGPVRVNVSVNGRRRWGRKEEGDSGDGPERLIAPMPGKIVKVLAKPGDRVQARQPLVVIEAMKMENELRAARAGTVTEIHAAEGASVDAGALLAVLSAD
ncbi:MAG TPA: biotin/lipoyl-containing protein [Vicinamibacterales bacterium]|jgi:biotin carboxyl carrier protein|nr:biotin/lipoyl-containing protein [Vicinamibacterales bacterium]